jgi:hypothetical protein
LYKSHYKVLTDNDVGKNGGHQAGITVPRKDAELLEFFPKLDVSKFNPDIWIYCTDPSRVRWKMRYIYYNGKTFSPHKSTRNEYRITHMTKLLRKLSASTGDLLVFTATNIQNQYQISIQKKDKQNYQSVQEDLGVKPIILRGWSKVY